MKRVAMRWHAPEHRAAGLAAVMLLSIVGSAVAGTIDFENPSLGSLNEFRTNVYHDQGVTITAGINGALIRESVWYPCPGVTETNQSFKAWTGSYCPWCCESIRIDFPAPPADAVYRVAAEVRADDMPFLRMDLYDAGGDPVGTSVQSPPSVSCTPRIRGFLQALALRPVAYAIIFNPPFNGGYDCTDGCCDGDLLVIDNVSFDGGAVPVRPSTWGALKVHYR